MNKPRLAGEAETTSPENSPLSVSPTTASSEQPRAARLMRISLWLGVGLVAICLALGFYVLSLRSTLPSKWDIKRPHLDFASTAYTADGEVLARYYTVNRTWVDLHNISDHAVNALVATEDHRFYDHGGIDVYRTMASVFHTLRGETQGGSTITQQLARNIFTEVGREVSVSRKVKEMMLARQLERYHSKDNILALYLNAVPFGNNAFGIEAAAQTYFSKPAHDLSETEAATLIGLLKGTSYYNPRRYPERAKVRRNIVLQQMVKHGYIASADADSLLALPVALAFREETLANSMAPHFAAHVQQWAEREAEKLGYNLYTDGLVIRTTLDSRLQALAQASLERQMDGLQAVVDVEWGRRSGYYLASKTTPYETYTQREDFEPFGYFWRSRERIVNQFIRETAAFRKARANGLSAEEAIEQLKADTTFMEALKRAKTHLSAGLVAIDPERRHIKAWVGGRDFTLNQYDHVALARRQPGSTFKPFVYAAALDRGYSPHDRLPDYPLRIQLDEGNVWSPANAGGRYSYDLMTLRDGLAHSKNTITAQLMSLVQPSWVARYARNVGVNSSLDPVPSLALGTSDVTLLEMTNAYATFASGGIYQAPQFITRIEKSSGEVIRHVADATARRAVSRTTAYTVVDMLRGVVKEGTARRLDWQFGLHNLDVAAKTGTTQRSADGWLIAMHPEMVVGAWVGFNDPRLTFRTNFWGQGAHNALFVAGDFLKQVAQDDTRFAERRFAAPFGYGEPTPYAPYVEEEEPHTLSDFMAQTPILDQAGISYIVPDPEPEPAEENDLTTVELKKVDVAGPARLK